LSTGGHIARVAADGHGHDRPMPHPVARLAVPLLTTVLVGQPAAAAALPDRWQAPLTGPLHVVRPFAPPTSAYGAGHRGVDLAATPGAPVLAAGSGTVRFAGQVGGRGVVVVAHRSGFSTEYEPLLPAVSVGSRVRAGAVLGALGATRGHCGAAGCLHWGLRRGAEYLDPMLLLSPPRAPILLPFLDRAVPTDRRDPPGRPGGDLFAVGAAAGGTGLAAAAVPAARRVRRVRPSGSARPWRASDRPGSR
jgi:hypothetical protein